MSVHRLSYGFIILLSAIAALSPTAMDMYLPAFPSLVKSFHTETSQVQASFQLYLLGFTLGQLFWGTISDSFGRKAPLLLSVGLYSITSVSFLVVTTIEQFNHLRFIQGIAGAGASVLVVAITKDSQSKNEFARSLSIITLVMSFVPLLSPTIGAHLTTAFNWKAIFLLMGSIALTVFCLVALFCRETLIVTSRLPFQPLSTINRYANVLTCRVFLGFTLTGAFAFSGVFAFLQQGTLVYQSIYHVSTNNTGYLFALNIVGMMLFNAINSTYVRRFGTTTMLGFGIGTQLVASITMWINLCLTHSLIMLVVGIILYAGVNASVYGNSLASALQNESQSSGVSSALYGASCFGLASFFGWILSHFLITNSVPMLVTMTLCSLLSLASFCWAATRR